MTYGSLRTRTNRPELLLNYPLLPDSEPIPTTRPVKSGRLDLNSLLAELYKNRSQAPEDQSEDSEPMTPISDDALMY